METQPPGSYRLELIGELPGGTFPAVSGGTVDDEGYEVYAERGASGAPDSRATEHYVDVAPGETMRFLIRQSTRQGPANAAHSYFDVEVWEVVPEPSTMGLVIFLTALVSGTGILGRRYSR